MPMQSGGLAGTFIFVALCSRPGPTWSRALSREADVGGQDVQSFSIDVLRAFEHKDKPFTQGLEISTDGKYLVETSGSYPPPMNSFVRIVDPATGAVQRSLTDGLEGRFAEGIVQMTNGNWFMSTYEDKKVIEYNSAMEKVGEHEYPAVGWGLTRNTDGGSFLATNGSDILMTLQKDSMKIVDTKVVTCLGKRVPGLNELEMVDNFMGLGPTLLGNVYQTRLVLAVNPATGKCTGVFNLEGGLMEPPQHQESMGFHVANGLAWNKTSQTLIATGKNWDQMFEVRTVPDPMGSALKILERHLSSLSGMEKERAGLSQADGKVVLTQVGSSAEPLFLQAKVSRQIPQLPSVIRPPAHI